MDLQQCFRFALKQNFPQGKNNLKWQYELGLYAILHMANVINSQTAFYFFLFITISQ